MSIAVVGFALAAYPAAVERGWMTRADAVARTLAALRFFHASDQSGSPEATGYKGFYYHFLDLAHRRPRLAVGAFDDRHARCLIAGGLAARMYFDVEHARRDGAARAGRRVVPPRRLALGAGRRGDDPAGLEARMRVPALWMGRLQRGDRAVRARAGLADAPARQRHATARGPRPTNGRTSTATTCSTRGRSSSTSSRTRGSTFAGSGTASCARSARDYFENSRRATYVQREYARRNPHEFAGYGEDCWGLTAGDGPGDDVPDAASEPARWFGYAARGVPYGPDDGTLSCAAVAGVAAVRPGDRAARGTQHDRRATRRCWPATSSRAASTRPSPARTAARGSSPRHYGLDQGHRGHDDRELPHAVDLAPDARLSLRHERAAARRVSRRLAGEAGRDRLERWSRRCTAIRLA